MPRLLSSCAAVLLLASGASAAAPPFPEARLGKDLDDFVTAVMKEYDVPGLSLAVVRDGKVVLVKGYGFRDVEKKQPVTGRTLFAIGSITKSFTVTELAMLVEEKKLKWDTKVRDILPAFRLHEKLPADRVTVRDLIAHRTGLPRHDAVWYLTTTGREPLLDRLRYLEPSADLREKWQYNNLMYAVAGLVVEKASGKSWEAFTRERILTPLGMDRTNLSVKDTPRSDDFARGYEKRQGGKVSRVDFRNIDPMGPAGSINSSAEEMAGYMRLHMGMGEWKGKRLISRDNAEEMQSPQMVMPIAELRGRSFDRPGDVSYGLGLFVSRHHNERQVWHSGGIDGFISRISFLPDHKLGVVVLTNMNADQPNLAPPIITAEIFDRLLGRTGTDWREKGREITRTADKLYREHKDKLAKDRKPDTRPTHALAEFAGKYENPAYGTLTINVAGEALRLSFSAATLEAKHYHYDTFVISDTEAHPAAMLEDCLVTFEVGKKGAIERVRVQTQRGVGDTVFTRPAKKGEK